MAVELYSLPAAGLAFLLAWSAAWLLVRLGATPLDAGRFASIDGLRGFLAFAVFVHHSSIWFIYLRTGKWAAPTSALFNQFGQGAVAIFFMITAFLFTTKILNAERGQLDWVRLYVGRITRLLPMYAVAVAVLWVMAWQLTGWMRKVPLTTLADEALGWAAFTIRGAPSVNGLTQARQLMASVTWTLPYEWWFYLSLPLIAWLLGRERRFGWVGLAIVSVLLVRLGWLLDLLHLLPFAGGIIAAFTARSARVRRFAEHWAASVVVIVTIAVTATFLHSGFDPLAVGLYSIAFVLIAAGSSVFGLLTNTASRLLGETTYSVYLLHGLLLTLVLRFIIGLDVAASWTTTQHWLLTLALVFPLVGLSYLGFRWIEAPGQRLAPRLLAVIRPERNQNALA
ncbi:acyltransferase [Propionicimonas sp.]|uniref:acyltransferase family protein n=1 Tax=Propionicimonas sp. TaxID=1955623 RepID=UPI0018501F8F|nr:acyltransferase [Propionicimonas sp.]MBU3976488.1 acyltransferase [Actinomycetota bacterium]MBA3020328.1 acyltransferase [Propionicimonas sp.]MBU3987320.1 acyltransferase [Actinomycetota bacterium]MBU4007632.1 acyltransferase [Actinomycetota bacterium]MBU4064413.1 acyltransferase [Actinomycetota bacterium]